MSTHPFPSLTATNHRNTSPYDEGYNCIAHAAGINDAWLDTYRAWPADVERGESVDHMRRVFESFGYQVCSGWHYEAGYEKVVIYGIGGKWKHAARQLDNGKWTSKMGKDVDIEHDTVQAVAGPVYGEVVYVMRRPVSTR